MKKRENFNFILIIILTAAMMVIPIVFGVALAELNSELDGVKSSMDATLEGDEIDDVEGYGLIAEGIGYGLGAFAGAIVLVVCILVGGYAFVLFLIALIARLIFAKEGKRLLAYRILMGFEYVLQGGILFFLITMLAEEFTIVPLIILLLVFAEIAYGVVNTYTKRICE